MGQLGSPSWALSAQDVRVSLDARLSTPSVPAWTPLFCCLSWSFHGAATNNPILDVCISRWSCLEVGFRVRVHLGFPTTLDDPGERAWAMLSKGSRTQGWEGWREKPDSPSRGHETSIHGVSDEPAELRGLGWEHAASSRVPQPGSGSQDRTGFSLLTLQEQKHARLQVSRPVGFPGVSEILYPKPIKPC